MTYTNAFFYTFFLLVALNISQIITGIISPFFDFRLFSSIFKKFSLFDLISYAGGFFLFYIYIKLKKPPFSFSFKMGPLRYYPLFFLAIGSMMFFYSFISSYIFNIIPYLGKLNKELELQMMLLAKHKISFFISSVFLAPILEELFFRGFILKELLRKKIHPIKAILFTSFLFGFIHIYPIQFLGGFFIGIILSTIYYQNKSLLDCIILHSFNNIIGFFLIINPNEGQIIEEQIKQVPLLVLFILLIISLLSIYVIYQKGIKKENQFSKAI